MWTHQSNKYTEELHHVSVGHRVKSSDQSVKDCDECRDHHRHLNVDVHDDAERSSWGRESNRQERILWWPAQHTPTPWTRDLRSSWCIWRRLLTKGRQDGGRPEDLAHQRRYEEEAAHALPIQLLEGIQHGDVTSRAHGLGEEQPPWDRRETEAHPQDLTVVLLTWVHLHKFVAGRLKVGAVKLMGR